MKIRNILTLTTAILIAGALKAQDYKVAKSTGRLDIKEVNNVRIEGSAGSEIIFTSENRDRDADERAKGLRAVSSLGLEDNTGLGLSVIDKNGVIEVRQLKKMDGPEIVIKVPKGVVVSYSHTSPYGEDIEFKNVEGEIETSTVHNGVKLENVTGPMKIKTVHGDIEASLPANIKDPASLTSVHGHVDVAFPVTIKATMKLATVYGEVFIDPDFKMEMDKKEGLVQLNPENLTGKINGGGINITLSSTHNNVYLRKK